MNDVGGLSRQARNAVLIHPDAVRQGRTRPRNPNGIEVGDLIVSRFPFHELQLHGSLGSMRMNDRTCLLSQITHGAEQWPRAARREPRRKAIPEPTAGGTMPPRAQVRALRQRLVCGFAQAGGVRRRVHETLAGRGANADRLERLERRAGMAHGFHVEDGRRAAEQ